MLFSFWYGQRCCLKERELEAANEAIAQLRDGRWKEETSVYINGSSFYCSSSSSSSSSSTDNVGTTTSRQDIALGLLQALRTNESAKTLIIQNCNLTPSLRDALVRVFEENASLRVIRLYKVYYQEAAAGDDVSTDTTTPPRQHRQQPFAVPGCLFSNNARRCLEEVSLQECSLDRQACIALQNMLICSSKTRGSNNGAGGALRKLSLKSTCFSSPSDVVRVLKGMRSNESVTELYLEKLNLTDDGGVIGREIVRTLASNKTLSKLSLRDNNFGPEFVRALMSRGLRRNNTTLRTLYLSRNPVGALGAQYIIEGLQQQQHHSCSSLRELCLVQAGIGREGCLAIARGLRTATASLRTLSLDGNEGIVQCAPAFLEALQTNVHIRQILECPFGASSSPFAKAAAASSDAAGLLANEWKQVDLFLRWNRANRRVLGEQQPAAPSASLLPRVLSGVESGQADVLYQFVREMPSSLTQQHYNGSGLTTSRSRGGKVARCSSESNTNKGCDPLVVLNAIQRQDPAGLKQRSCTTTTTTTAPSSSLLASFAVVASPSIIIVASNGKNATSFVQHLPSSSASVLASPKTKKRDHHIMMLPGKNRDRRRAFMTNLLASAMIELDDEF